MNRLKEVGNAALDLLFPPHCAVCQRAGAWLCPTCLAEIETIQPPVCRSCGLPIDNHRPSCQACREEPPAIDGIRSYAFHSGPLRLAIHQLKYQNLRAVAEPLGALMGRGWEELQPADLEIGAIVPVPLHPARQRERGYNQAALLARALGTALQRPVVEQALARTKATAPQVDLDAGQRKDNVHNAFAGLDHSLAGQTVLLVDDVCTTGATLEAAGRALQDLGVSCVWAYTLARAR
jgi:ComF family protein